MCIVKPDGSPQLCKTDEIGEIVINSRAGGTMYYGLPGVTKNTFEVCGRLKFCVILSGVTHLFCFQVKPNIFSFSFNIKVIPVNQAGAPIGEIAFTRTGLLGFVGPVRIGSLPPEF